MPITSTVKGDLVERAKQGHYTHIIHGCNCNNVMGAGIAPQIAKAFEGVLEADENFHVPVGDKERLGDYSYSWSELAADVEGGYPARGSNWVCVVNLYTQFGTGGRRIGEPDVDYNAIEEGFKILNTLLGDGDYKVGIPMIGAGLAGGDWVKIEEIINRVAPDLEIELVIFDK